MQIPRSVKVPSRSCQSGKIEKLGSAAVSESWPEGQPVLVRKLGRKNHWGSPDQDIPQRVNEIVSRLFDTRERPFSLYKVSSSIELDRVALALNAGRSSLTEDLSFAFFPWDEFVAAKISLAASPGDTPCHHANLLHFDADADPSEFTAIVEGAISRGQEVVVRSKGQMKVVVQQATRERCDVITARPDSAVEPGCIATGCSTASN